MTIGYDKPLWLTTAAAVPGFPGPVKSGVGWGASLSASRSGGRPSGSRWWTTGPRGSRAKARWRQIAAAYREWVDVFESAK
jgi:hypothetical protein